MQHLYGLGTNGVSPIHVRLVCCVVSGFGLWIGAVIPFGGLVACVALVPVILATLPSRHCAEAAFWGTAFSLAWAIPKMEWLALMGCRSGELNTFIVGWCFVMLVLVASHALGVVACFWLCSRRGWLCSMALPSSWLGAELLADVCLRSGFGLTLDPLRIVTTQLNGSPLVQCADLGGAPLVGWLVALANGLAVDAICFGKSTVRSRTELRLFRVMLSLMFAAVLYGLIRPGTCQ